MSKNEPNVQGPVEHLQRQIDDLKHAVEALTEILGFKHDKAMGLTSCELEVQVRAMDRVLNMKPNRHIYSDHRTSHTLTDLRDRLAILEEPHEFLQEKIRARLMEKLDAASKGEE